MPVAQVPALAHALLEVAAVRVMQLSDAAVYAVFPVWEA